MCTEQTHRASPNRLPGRYVCAKLALVLDVVSSTRSAARSMSAKTSRTSVNILSTTGSSFLPVSVAHCFRVLMKTSTRRCLMPTQRCGVFCTNDECFPDGHRVRRLLLMPSRILYIRTRQMAENHLNIRVEY